MSLFTNNKMGNFIRGGQTTIHYLRMIGQVIKQFTWASLMIAFLCYLAILYVMTTPAQRTLAVEYSQAWFHAELYSAGDTQLSFHLPSGKRVQTTAGNVINNREVSRQIHNIQSIAEQGSVYAAVCWVVALILFIKFIYATGHGHKEDQHVRGGSMVPTKELNKIIHSYLKTNKESAGILNICGITLPQSFEPAHMLLAGDPGTGKSNLLRQIFSILRTHNMRVIIYDRSGDFVKNFYRPKVDVILNPLDQRSANWSIFEECKQEHEFFHLANSFIPDVKSNDPFWGNAARIIFASLAFKESKSKTPSIDHLLDMILHSTLDELVELCAGTDAQAIVAKGGEKMAISVRGVVASYVRALKYVPGCEAARFSIKQWVQDESTDSWIFITSNKAIHDTIKPLITTWLDLATSSILALEPDLSRRIWTVIDELPTLNKLPSVQTTPAESRKYGGCFILGFQNYPQLVDIYGKNGADALCGSCSTSVIFRCNDPTFADWGAKQLGRAETVETTEGISYGVNEIRDGVNLGKQKKERSIVLATELQNLPDLQGYIKLGRGFPVGRFVDDYQHFDTVQPGYVSAETSFEKRDPVSFGDSENESVKQDIEEDYLGFGSFEKSGSETNIPAPKEVWLVNTDVKLKPASSTSSKSEQQTSTNEDTTSSSGDSSSNRASGFLRGNTSKTSGGSAGDRAPIQYEADLGDDMEME
ncbi:type IV secretion system DNA-binding domain-containing protein [Pseudoalteromonas luteoviolacea]|uniref:type IV secretion system DNA-binding domain-containing protein n=1 Tax=Pseudoalteromonas luteoviolacea TaxID=43657 RepID=UPI001B38CC85|nr:type IV secretion system DNA-binding domain-containing protein [Pseudoalteromonas luteoviolacea]MBQ4839778.1 type IV secretion system DNA-binding domain-containing protein [Pseudoalteromonas luteoviolacea]